jgi:hypothetical protein
MESTGKYGFALADYLFNQGEKISIVNPFKIKHFAKSLMLRNKTDNIDAMLIAHYCQSHSPVLWSPKPAKIQRLRALLKRMAQLEAMQRQDKNRLELENNAGIIKSINTVNDILPAASYGVSFVRRAITTVLVDFGANIHNLLCFLGFEHNFLIAFRHHVSLRCS